MVVVVAVLVVAVVVEVALAVFVLPVVDVVVVVVVVEETVSMVRGQGAGLHHLASLLAALHSTESAWSPLGCLSLI